jgi:hypothetical protein
MGGRDGEWWGEIRSMYEQEAEQMGAPQRLLWATTCLTLFFFSFFFLY